MKTFMGVEGIHPLVLTSALHGGEWSASCPGRFTPDTDRIGDWVGTRAVLDALEKIKFRNPARTARSLSLYQLSSPGS
jgi:hypothetical protein